MAQNTINYSASTLDGRLAICASSTVTINGKPGKVIGAKCDFATLVDVATGDSWEAYWDCVEEVMNNGGRFIVEVA